MKKKFIILLSFSVFIMSCASLSKKEAHEAYIRGLRALNENKIDYAISEFSEAIRLHPVHISAHLERGKAYMRGSNPSYDLARLDFMHIIEFYEQRPNNDSAPNRTLAEAYALYGRIYERIGDYNNALLYYDKALSIDKSNTIAYYNKRDLLRTDNARNIISLGNTARDRNEFDEASIYYRRAIAISPYGGEVYNEAQTSLKNLWNQRVNENSHLFPYPAPFDGTWRQDSVSDTYERTVVYVDHRGIPTGRTSTETILIRRGEDVDYHFSGNSYTKTYRNNRTWGGTTEGTFFYTYSPVTGGVIYLMHGGTLMFSYNTDGTLYITDYISGGFVRLKKIR